MAQDNPFGPARDQTDTRAPLVSQVISALYERQTTTQNGARQVVVDYLLRAATVNSSFDATHVMEELRQFRLSVDAVVDLYIPQVARNMGELWETSDIDFATVTIGSLRLQALLNEASIAPPYANACPSDAPLALVVVAEGEHHFLGGSVVAAQMRRLGWDVSLSIAEEPTQITNRVIHDQPDMVLISCAQMRGLETIAQNVNSIRQATDPAPAIALGGAIRGDIEDIRKKTGVDLVTKSAKDLVGFFAQRRKAKIRK